MLHWVNLMESRTEASHSNRRYSALSVTTTPEPLSGLVITKSSRRLRLLMACNRALGGVGLRLAM